MYVHLGTYDGGIVSFEGEPDSLRPTNNFQASENSIRTLHRTGKYLIAGGFDETIHIYDVVRNRQQGEIDPEQGPLTQLVSDGRILISAGAQGSIKMWQIGSFEFLHQLKEHKSQIEHLIVGGSGRIMLSVGKDRKLVMWNLLKAIRIFDRKLDFDVSKVLLTEDRKKLVLFSEHQIQVVETESNNEVSRIESKEKLQDCLLYLERFIIAATESGWVNIWPLDDFTFSMKFKAGDCRIKCLAAAKLHDQDILLTASSNGQLCVWDVLNLLREMETITQDYPLDDLKPLRKLEIGQRIICMIAGTIESKPVPPEKKPVDVEQQQPVHKTKKKHSTEFARQTQEQAPLQEVHRKKKIKKLRQVEQSSPANPKQVRRKKQGSIPQ